jgi:uncharacterized protein
MQMSKRSHLSLLAVLALAVAGVAAAATDATPDQISRAAQSGHLVEAQQMIAQVLQDHPQNAKAHFFAAEIDARIGDFSAARDQLATARQLDPSESFTNPQALRALERQLTGMRAVMPVSPVQPFAPVVHHSSVPWGLIIILAIGAFILFAIFRGRSQSYGSGYGPGYGQGQLPPGNPGMQPGYGYGPGYPPPGGSGLMGNLASGLAIGAGVAAGEELVHHVIDGNSPGAVPPAADLRDPQNQDMGGPDFGSQDGSSWGNDSSGGGDSGGWGGDSGGGGGGDWT